MRCGSLPAGSAYRVVVPLVVIFPILSASPALAQANHRLPSGPAVTSEAMVPAPGVTVNGFVTPFGEILVIMSVSKPNSPPVNHMLPSEPTAISLGFFTPAAYSVTLPVGVTLAILPDSDSATHRFPPEPVLISCARLSAASVYSTYCSEV